jgi:hypothetical protein
MRIFALVMMFGITLNCYGKVESVNDEKSDVVTVRVKGEGVDEKSAVNDALRKALEKGGHLEIYSESHSENYQLIRDTILARVTGLIKDYKILRKKHDESVGYIVEIEAKVDRKLIDATWGQVQILLQQMGKPKILVSFVERINDMAITPHKERVDADSLLGNKIEELLIEKGFQIVDKKQMEELKQSRLQQATIDQDTASLKRFAGELGAQMYIVGYARASGPDVQDAYGVTLYMWETDVTLSAFWSETGEKLFAKSDVGTRSGSRAPGPPGAKKAIEKAGEKLAWECLQSILEKWSRTAVGGGKIILEVKGLDFKRMLSLNDALKQIEGVAEVNREWHKPTAKFDIVTVHSAEKFAEILSDLNWPGYSIDIDDQKFNTIFASVVKSENKERTDSAPTTSSSEKEKETH